MEDWENLQEEIFFDEESDYRENEAIENVLLADCRGKKSPNAESYTSANTEKAGLAGASAPSNASIYTLSEVNFSKSPETSPLSEGNASPNEVKAAHSGINSSLCEKCSASARANASPGRAISPSSEVNASPNAVKAAHSGVNSSLCEKCSASARANASSGRAISPSSEDNASPNEIKAAHSGVNSSLCEKCSASARANASSGRAISPSSEGDPTADEENLTENGASKKDSCAEFVMPSVDRVRAYARERSLEREQVAFWVKEQRRLTVKSEGGSSGDFTVICSLDGNSAKGTQNTQNSALNSLFSAINEQSVEKAEGAKVSERKESSITTCNTHSDEKNPTAEAENHGEGDENTSANTAEEDVYVLNNGCASESAPNNAEYHDSRSESVSQKGTADRSKSVEVNKVPARDVTYKESRDGLEPNCVNSGEKTTYNSNTAKTGPDSAHRVYIASGRSAVAESKPTRAHYNSKIESEPQIEGNVISVNICHILPNPNQPRKDFDENAIRRLSDSIRQFGIIQPITVRKSVSGYEIISGERRFRAAKELGLSHVPCIVSQVTDEKSAEMSIIENLIREDLNIFEQAESIEALIEIHGLTQEQVAEHLSCSQSFIANKLRLLRLSKEERELIIANKLTERHARALLRVSDEASRRSILQVILSHKLNVAQTEELVEEAVGNNVKEKGQRARFKDSAAFCASLNRSLERLRENGVAVRSKTVEGEEYTEITIILPKKS